jgi:hypothetical protein
MVNDFLNKRLTNMRGITCWLFVIISGVVSYVHPTVAGAVMASAAFVAGAFMGVSGYAETRQQPGAEK